MSPIKNRMSATIVSLRFLQVLGLISDTHGLLRPSAVDALRGVDLVVHAGDVGAPEVLDRLRQIAPVIAVRGNVDRGGWASELPKDKIVETECGPLYVLHNLADLDLDPAAAGFAFVVSGHSHKAQHERRGNVTYINPGAAGQKRFRLPVTLARLRVDKTEYQLEFIDLEAGTAYSIILPAT